MISLILPYWERLGPTHLALECLWQHYKGLDLEVVLVDDGSVREPWEADGVRIPMVVRRLPMKLGPRNPCVPYNRGVEVSKGDFIALSNPETLHVKPVLAKMRETIENASRLSPNALPYVMAAAWCPEQQRWHCHGSRERSNDDDVGAWLPRGSDYHFMTMMKRSLWDAAGGFDEDYRDGAGYDDPDFVRRLHRAGANFIRRDDLVVEHVRSGAHAPWTSEMFARNRAVFMSKWAPLNAAVQPVIKTVT